MMVANKIIFTHSHILANGQVISHAHPYDKSSDSEPFKSHHHTQSELLFFENLKILFPLVFLLFVLKHILQKTKLFIYYVIKIYPASILLHKGRSPPVL
ncbi:MAG: hypothetical protein JW723_05130 [Bacteroidales bacterium]|nr:hypothetical protein [Bacteroidales bacterium]